MPQSPLSSAQIRQEFLDFFREKGHMVVSSAPLVPQDDPTLLFTNAGMNQFKDVFLGTGSRSYKRAADTQKCLRVSGKHNDLEEVGYDLYHHTFFEMLGNWSFGDYFKKEAIIWAWELLVDRWGLDPDRLYATVHEGDEALGLEADTEAAELWTSETSIDPDHVLFCASKDNFWMMGDTGPCGPCSEIHIDLRTDEERQQVDGAALVNADDPRVMEIWNLVFIQYNAQPDGTLKPLAAKHVDTGMGFERIVGVLQETDGSTYDTDLFAPILAAIAERSSEIDSYASATEKQKIAMRVVADHLRTVAFAIADGAQPGNTGRGYVIRRILRRAVRYGYQALGLREPFLYTLVSVLVDKMGAAFPELSEKQDYIERVTKAEEESFLRTLEEGLALFDTVLPYAQEGGDGQPESDRALKGLLDKAYVGHTMDEALVRFKATAAEGRIPGEIAFLLHDTYGFPSDLTALMAREEGLGVDMEGFDRLMTEQRERARAAGQFGTHHSQIDTWAPTAEAKTHGGRPIRFVGYDTLTWDGAHILKTRTVGEDDTQQHELVLDATPFYAESGGQVGDRGTLEVGEETIQVLDTQKDAEGTIIHIVDRLPSDLDAPVLASVDPFHRLPTQQHHTATHLLHAALREILGPHVQQKGSLVAPDRLRFDFSHYERVGNDELRQIERRINRLVQQNIPRGEEREVPIEEAKARGAMALFGEKYGEAVRVITFDPDVSVELCGGTHVSATGEIGLVKLTSEGSVASGVRRIEAVAGEAALDYLDALQATVEAVQGQFKSLGRPVEDEVADVLEARKLLEREVEALRLQNLEGNLDRFIAEAVSLGNARLAVGQVPAVDMNALRDLGQMLRDRLGEGGIGVLGTVDPEGEKVYLVAVVTDDLIEQGVQAGKLVGALAKRVGGGGGGRPNLATAGGKKPEKLGEALDAVPDEVRALMG